VSDIQTVSVCVLLGILVLTVLGAVVYDVWVARRYGVEATISRGMQRLGLLAPIFPFGVGILLGLVIGVLAGHFWWSQ
jgi:uncharacterized membrane protein